MWAYHAGRYVTSLFTCTVFGFRAYHLNRTPRSGGVLVLSNHQSHLDPVFLGDASLRPLRFMARDTLFRGGFAHLIRSLGAYPVTRGKRDEAAFKHTAELLKEGQVVLIFGEGTRSLDGEIQPVKGGIEILARRSKAPILPMVVDGPRDIMPKGRSLLQSVVPALPVRMVVGDPIPAEVYRTWPKRSMPVRLREVLIDLLQEAREKRASSLPGITVLTRDLFPVVLAWLRWFLRLVAGTVRLAKALTGSRSRSRKRRVHDTEPVGVASGDGTVSATSPSSVATDAPAG